MDFSGTTEEWLAEWPAVFHSRKEFVFLVLNQHGHLMIQYIADAFTDTLFAGNPAAVLPCREMPSPELMQAIAIENNYSETAFVVKRGEGAYDLKWFTPGGEVALCGHATLATSFVLHRFADKGVAEMHFHTLSGELIVNDGFPCGYLSGNPCYGGYPVCHGRSCQRSLL